MGRAFVIALVLAAASPAGPPLVWIPQPGPATERLRAVSAVSRSVVWASGNRGTVVRTADGGGTWAKLTVPGAEALDFRDIEAVDARTAYVLSIGPGDKSRIYKTSDAGATWTLQFTSADPKAFYDAIAFWDAQHGLAVGDPVDGRFTILRTADGGRSWTLTPADSRPDALPGDGMFAASGTCLVVSGKNDAWMGTGGAARARVFHSVDRGLTWSSADVPIAAGAASAGVFSIAFADGRRGLAVGGDYRKEGESGDNVARSDDGGRTWTPTGVARLRGFRSAVAWVPGSPGEAIAVGPAGTDRTTDGGATWASLGNDGFHALSIAPSGDAAWAVGEQGRIAKLTGIGRRR
jgi:photosystem II stability/assembly factor-like uncharacterized protein